MLRLRVRFLAVTVAVVATFGCAAWIGGCGDDASSPGFRKNGPDQTNDGGGDAMVDLRNDWPDGDTADGDVPDGAPTFANDAGGSDDAGDAAATTTCGATTGPLGDSTMMLTFGGLARTAIVHTPDGWDGTTPRALVVNFHGFTSDAVQEQILSRMNGAADEHGYVVVYPYGVATSWNAGQCCGTAWADAVDDVGFVGALLDQLETTYCIDEKRVYATGMSNGGFFSYRLGCEMSDRFAAISPVAGVLGIAADACTPKRPVPVLHFHGTADPLVPYEGGNPLLNIGLQGVLDFPSVADTMAVWRKIDGCPDTSTTIYQVGDATCIRWGPCAMGSEVVLCTIDGGGHTWPGGVPIPPLGKTSTDISATETMSAFFFAHPL